MLQKTHELLALQDRVQSLQTSNELLQEQTKAAHEERDRVQKDHHQVVYELGKAQKQLNAMAKGAMHLADNDALVQQMEQLKQEKDELVGRLKDAEVLVTA